MAKREELQIIRAARAGQASAQLALGKRYLFGGSGLPKNTATALYWLDRAAHQHEPDAWMLIGNHIPFDTVRHVTQSSSLYVWYERAFDAGVAQAGLVLARLVFTPEDRPVDESLRRKARRALEVAAHTGIPEAQWLLAQQIGKEIGQAETTHAMLRWAQSAAESGIVPAQRALGAHAWTIADYPTFLQWSLPIARQLAQRHAFRGHPVPLCSDDASLLSRCAYALSLGAGFDSQEVEQFWALAAQAGDWHAQYYSGLWFAKMDTDGMRVAAFPMGANYKKALHRLTLAGEQGVAGAWYAMSKIYQKPEFSQRNLADAQHCLERAAQAGLGIAQYELGKAAWRTRRNHPANDIRAAYWLQKAAVQGHADAPVLLQKIATPSLPAPWAQALRQRLTRGMINLYPFLAARIELAALFGLSRAEALLLDPNQADCGHCLLIDVRVRHARSKRRLILLQTGEERQTLDRVKRLFEDRDCGPHGPEGNYRQRVYRLGALFDD